MFLAMEAVQQSACERERSFPTEIPPNRRRKGATPFLRLPESETTNRFQRIRSSMLPHHDAVEVSPALPAPHAIRNGVRWMRRASRTKQKSSSLLPHQRFEQIL